jgi:cytochrome P450
MTAPLAMRARDAVAAATARLPAAGPSPYAEPPAGSGLRPVMGDPGPPVLGHTLDFLRDQLGSAHRFRARYGNVFWTYGLGTRIISVLGPDAIGTVLANHDGAFSSERGWSYFIGPFFHRGVMLMDAEEHRHHRRIMQQAFRHERLVGYLAAMQPVIGERLDAWPAGHGFRLYRAVKNLTLDVATRVFVGEPLGPESDRMNRAFIATVEGGNTPLRRDLPIGRWHRGLESRRWLEQHFGSRLEAKREGDSPDLFSVLARAESEDGHRFSDDDVVNHMIFTMMAAHDTSTITAAMIAYYLAVHPEWQERLREESVAVGRGTITHEDFDALPSLELVFRETLRMNAPVGIVARRTVHDVELDGYFIPADAQLTLGIFATQRMEPWWRDPDRFDPERFSPERREDHSHKHAWIPFGSGVHKCIGLHFGTMEVKAILHAMLLRFRWSVPAGYEPPMDYGTGPLPGDGLPVRLERL